MILLCFSDTRAQHYITGKVVDAADGAPLALSHVLVENTGSGTTTNREGRFMVRVPELPASLIIRHLGYHPVRVVVRSRNAHIEVVLRAAVLPLDSVNVSANYAEDLVRLAYEKAVEARNDRYTANAFYRQITKSDTVYTEMLEMFFTAHTSNDGIALWRLDHGRYAVRPDTFTNNYIYTRDYSTFTHEFSLTQRAAAFWQELLLPLRPHASRHFSFEIEDRIVEDGRSVARVQFRPHDHRRKPAFEGDLFIDEDSFDVLRFTAAIRNPRYIPLRIRGGRSHIDGPIEMHYDISYRVLPEGDVVLDFIQIDAFYTQERRREFRRAIHTQSLMLFYGHDFGDRPRGLRRPSRSVSDYQMVDRRRYDPDFWRNNRILLDTPLEQAVIESFEESGSFGKVFN